MPVEETRGRERRKLDVERRRVGRLPTTEVGLELDRRRVVWGLGRVDEQREEEEEIDGIVREKVEENLRVLVS